MWFMRLNKINLIKKISNKSIRIKDLIKVIKFQARERINSKIKIYKFKKILL